MKDLIVLTFLFLFGTLYSEDRVLSDAWRFSRMDDVNIAQDNLSFVQEDFDDSTWSFVEIPHDWAIEGPFNQSSKDGDTGKLPWRGVGVYRKLFVLSPHDVEGSVVFDFDGAMTRPRVYVNGCYVGGWDYGYQSFRVDASKYVKNGTNLLAVVCDTRQHRSRWYPGAGLTRKVVLRTLPCSHFTYNGIKVTTPVVEKNLAIVRVEWETESTPDDALVKVLIEREGVINGSGVCPVTVGSMELKISEPMLWDVTNPVLYRVQCVLRSVNGKDEKNIRFGIRKIDFPVATGTATNDWTKNGFHLNGRRVQLKGVNLHEDMGLLGRAYNRFTVRRQLLLMKEMGANAIRTSHNPVAPETLDMCDELGLLVWDECFDKWDDTASRYVNEPLEPYIARNLRMFVRRDRNHPSVIVWSMGNEIGGLSSKKDGFAHDPDGLSRARCAFFREEMLKEDVTRPIGNGNMPHMAKKEFFNQGIWDDLDITGWNYLASHEKAKAVYPHKPVVYTESCSAGSTYGFYVKPSVHPFGYKVGAEFIAKQMDSYDLGTTIDIVDYEFDRMEHSPWCAGEFVWAGIDYLGEPIPFRADARSSYFGIVDLTGVPKDRYWLYRSYWRDDALTVHLLPHWNWQGKEGEKVPVFVYTNGDAAELFVNGKSQGWRRKGYFDMPDGRTNTCYAVCGKYRLMWFDVVYEPGEVKAVAYKNGAKIGETAVRTAKQATSLRLTSEMLTLPNDGETLAYIHVEAVDDFGVCNPIATNRVNFTISGPGQILALGNGNPREMKSFKNISDYSLFYGKAMAIIRREGEGCIVLRASADGLRPAELRFN